MTDSEQHSLKSMAGHMVQGSAWMVAMRWTVRLIGLCSTVILARLLTPADYGLVAMGVIVLGFVQVFASTGFDLALIQKSDTSSLHYDTAWTLQVLQGIAVALVMSAIAPFAAGFYGEPRLTAVILVLALVPLIGGLANIGIVDFRKGLNFAKEFRFTICCGIVRFFLVVGLALYLRNYWALALGNVSGALVTAVLSYVMHPYRPRFSFAKTTEIWSFSQWIVLFHVGQYLKMRFDQFVVGRIGGIVAMGNYQVGNDFASMPTEEVVLPLGRALFPSYAKLAHDKEQADGAYLQVLAVVALIAIPVGIGFSTVADNMVLVIFGAKWSAAVPVIEWLAVGATASGIIVTSEVFLSAIGRARIMAIMTWVQFGLVAAAVIVAAYFGDIVLIAECRTLVNIAVVAVMFGVVASGRSITVGKQLAAIWKPMASSFVMAVAVEFLRAHLSPAPAIALVIDIAFGALVYALIAIGLWYVTGRPPGAEEALIKMMGRQLRRA